MCCVHGCVRFGNRRVRSAKAMVRLFLIETIFDLLRIVTISCRPSSHTELDTSINLKIVKFSIKDFQKHVEESKFNILYKKVINSPSPIY